MGKNLKIKHSVSLSSYKVWGNFFHKKALHEGTNIFGQIFFGGDVLHGDKQSDHARDEVNG